MDVGLPVVCVRSAEGRSGTTLLMQLLATSPSRSSPRQHDHLGTGDEPSCAD